MAQKSNNRFLQPWMTQALGLIYRAIMPRGKQSYTSNKKHITKRNSLK